MAGRTIKVITPEEQLRSVQRALESLRRAKRFRGKKEIVGDAARQLTVLEALHAQGKLEPIIQ